ncbi:hypothetical protein AVEN_201019-1 [Araneus ventricosus]|uniref:Uncharacterized protein n=1 Tax=Araneus ventricosus TaxID=182803 RepID=A0A4Y2KB14_ARAVE|nr:hypothetical protein AVEN_201019-1 [Araneus ventricosus]
MISRNTPPPDHFRQESEPMIPETLRIFNGNNHSKQKTMRTGKMVGNCKTYCTCIFIIYAMRSKSFIPSMQIGLAAFLYKKNGSRKSIVVLSPLGFCSSSTEAVRFEVSSIISSSLEINDKAVSQFAYDNADFNVQTLDEYNTFHAMGSIHCVCPKRII